jgi:hypothetical protein
LGRLDWRRCESLIAIGKNRNGYDTAIVRITDAPRPRKFGARSAGLFAPNLAYMCQDKRFRHGETVGAPLFAALRIAHDGAVISAQT